MKQLTIKGLAFLLVAGAIVALGGRADDDDAAAEAVGEMLMIHVLAADGTIDETIPAMFNPAEYSIKRTVPWQKHRQSKGDDPVLEFTSGEPMTLSFELFFETDDRGDDIKAITSKIHELAQIDSETHRPPQCLVVWGSGLRFESVLTSFSTKFTNFLPDGTPVRAKVTTTFTQCTPEQKKR